MKNLSSLLAGSLLAWTLIGCQSAGPSRGVGGSAAPPVFQLRLVVDAPSDDSEPMTVVPGIESTSRAEVLNVRKAILLDQSGLRSAQASADAIGQPVILLEFTPEGGKRLAEVTRQNLGKRLAIIIDGRLYQAPVVRSEITGGKAQVSGRFTEAEAKVLAGKLAGAATRK